MFMAGIHMMASSPSSEWPRIAETVRRAQPEMDFRYEPNGKWTAPPAEDPGSLGFMMRDFGFGFDVSDSDSLGTTPGEPGMRLIAVRMPDQTVISGKVMMLPPPPRPAFPAWSFLIFALVFLPLIYFWAAWGLSRQLKSFARAAEGFSVEGQHQQLPENGPEEIAQVARALNRMRERIMGLLADRTRMLSAIGHDLRTPITRLRLRAEFIEDQHTRLDILKDLDRMNRMVDSALTYIRDGRDSEKEVAVDLPALLRTVSDNFSDVGEHVSYKGLERLSIVARPDALVRAVENLVENALKYGSRAVVRCEWGDGEQIIIEVEDDGAGIAEDKRQAMLEPFVRGDAARNGSAGGFGLGLSITDSIARAHGGRLELSSGRMGGLLARLVLPASGGAAPQPDHRRVQPGASDIVSERFRAPGRHGEKHKANHR
ncbi:MAG: ATP-binding protein [Devosia sp.]|nr:ATP-binding protein [Devosia sp.]